MSYKKGPLVGNWVEERYGAELAANPRKMDPGVWATTASKSFATPSADEVREARLSSALPPSAAGTSNALAEWREAARKEAESGKPVASPWSTTYGAASGNASAGGIPSVRAKMDQWQRSQPSRDGGFQTTSRESY